MSLILPDQSGELVLTESRTMRAQTADRVDVLDKVKALALLPDGVHATTEIVAAYFEVPISTIKSLVAANREELEANGYRALKGAELREFASPFGGPANLGLHHNTRSLAVFSRRAVLNVGQLLTGSEVAEAVRTHLLDSEAGQRQASVVLVPRTLPEVLRAYADEVERNDLLAVENAELSATVDKLSPKARRAEQYETNPGISPTEFHKTWFPQVRHAVFFEHLYRKDYLIDERNKRWDERKQEWKDGPHHMWPTAKGKRYFYLHPSIDARGFRREQTLVIPGDAEHDLVAALERESLPSRNRPALPGAVVQMPSQRRIGGVR